MLTGTGGLTAGASEDEEPDSRAPRTARDGEPSSRAPQAGPSRRRRDHQPVASGSNVTLDKTIR